MNEFVDDLIKQASLSHAAGTYADKQELIAAFRTLHDVYDAAVEGGFTQEQAMGIVFIYINNAQQR